MNCFKGKLLTQTLNDLRMCDVAFLVFFVLIYLQHKIVSYDLLTLENEKLSLSYYCRPFNLVIVKIWRIKKKILKNLDIWLKTWILARTKKQWPMAALIKESWLPFVGHTRLIFNLRGNLIFAQPLNSFSIIAKRVTATS